MPPERDDAPVIFLHPIGLDAEAARFLDAPEMLAPTLPGFGVRTRRAGLTLDDAADEIAGWTEGPVHLVGCSMGGMVAMHFALRFPERTASLVLGYTGARVDPGLMADRALEVERDGSAALAGPTMSRWFTPEALDRSPLAHGVAYARQMLLDTGAERIADGWRAIAGHDVLGSLDRLAGIPVTCIAGRRDQSTPLAAVEAMAGAIPGARLVVTDHPHMGFLEEPDEFDSLLRQHLDRLSGDPA